MHVNKSTSTMLTFLKKYGENHFQSLWQMVLLRPNSIVIVLKHNITNVTESLVPLEETR